MDPRIILGLVGFGVALLLKEIFTKGESDVHKSRDRNSGGSDGKQDSTIAKPDGRERIIINNIYGEKKAKPKAAGAEDLKKKGKIKNENVEPISKSSKVNSDPTGSNDTGP